MCFKWLLRYILGRLQIQYFKWEISLLIVNFNNVSYFTFGYAFSLCTRDLFLSFLTLPSLCSRPVKYYKPIRTSTPQIIFLLFA